MNLREAEAYLLDLELFGMRFGLDRMHKLMTVLGMPQRRFASIHVVGSNGKSSTTRMIAAILERHGVATGTYTSPHLRSFAERIEVGGRPLAGPEFAAAVERVARAARLVDRTLEEGDRVTQFEALTAAAYTELARRGVEVAVIEAGLGGRYDATNVIPSKVQVLTGVGLEHTRWLGPTVADIADEKLAVVRDHATLVIGPDLDPDAEAVAVRVVSERHATLVRAPTDATDAPARAPGPFQRRNFALAREAAGAFLGDLDEAAVRSAADEVAIPGRLEVVGESPLTIYDGAHNPSGARALVEALPEVMGERRPRVAVIAVLDDKDAAGMLRELLPAVDRAVFTRSAHPRSLTPATLMTLSEQLGGPPAEVVADARAAVDRARAIAGPGGAVLTTGSIYLIAELVRDDPTARASAI
ncbi:MAG TPA: cyanophycin synthetase [Thermoleophilaceae bacterium]|nr:cyanophycin synthetase [Thermoleophilaceae bacterium]